LKGFDLAFGTGEYRTPTGMTQISRDQISQINDQVLVPAAIRQAIGFPSPAVADLREAFRIQREIQQQNRPFAESINNKLALAEADRLRAQRDNNPAGVQEARRRYDEAIRELNERNQRFIDSREFDRVHYVSRQAIQRQAYQMFYGRTSPEIMGMTGRPAVRAELQELQRRYAPQ
jgi:hypothetical protein